MYVSLSHIQNLVGTLERSRSVMAEDLSTLSAENEALKTEVEEIPHLKDKLLVLKVYLLLLMLSHPKLAVTAQGVGLMYTLI